MDDKSLPSGERTAKVSDDAGEKGATRSDSGSFFLGDLGLRRGASFARGATPPGGVAVVKAPPQAVPPPLPNATTPSAAPSTKSFTPSKPHAGAGNVAEPKVPSPLPGAVKASEKVEAAPVDAGFDSIPTVDEVGPHSTLGEGGDTEPMAQFSREDVLRRAKLKQSLARTDLSGLDLSNASLEGVDLSRAVLDGTNLNGAKLAGANLKNASLQKVSLEGADLTQANCERADFGEGKLARARLDGASLKRASLEGADLSHASLKATSLAGAELTGASLVEANLEEADLSHAELGAANLTGANLTAADLDNAVLSGADLADCNLSRALLNDADLCQVNAARARFEHASLERANLEEANLCDTDLAHADARHANFANADLTNARLEGVRLGKAVLGGIKAKGVRGDVVDASEQGDGSELVTGPRVASFLAGKVEPAGSGTRYFGRGDVLRDAVLVFEPNSSVHIDSRFENCSLSLGDGVELTVGDSGVLKDCEIRGKGNITIHGRFFERKAPGIVGPKSLVVSARGAMVGAVEQSEETTVFAFQPGCRLRVKILRPAAPQVEPVAAE
jgi:uncharacterized protein YjbI with pentapeptide repeats